MTLLSMHKCVKKAYLRRCTLLKLSPFVQNQLGRAREEVCAAYAQQVLLYLFYCSQLKATGHLY